MRHVANLLSNVSSETFSEPKARAPLSMAPLLSKATQQLWLRMTEVYGHRWTSSYGDDPAGSAATTWAKGLAGLSGAQLAIGIGACIACADPWPPTLPEFRMRCLGIPAFDAVRADVGKQDGFTRLVWQYLDGHRYRHASSDKSDKLLLAAYNRAKEFVMRGGELPAPPAAEIAAEHHESEPASRERVTQHMADIERVLGFAGAREVNSDA